MRYKSLYRTYRPQTFNEIVGQEHIKKTLQNAIKRKQIAHAYLFCGPRGTGKTSIAKIFALALNCENNNEAPCGYCDICKSIDVNSHPDIIEIDAASNNGVDEIRDLIDKVKYAPIELKTKVYIIDEVHMLTQGAFNALLKTLEEPPEHVVFVLATTEVHKVLPTILSRTQVYDFERVSIEDIKQRLTEVFENEQITADEATLSLIADLADGGMRDALTIAEQVIAYAGDSLQVEDVRSVYKMVSPEDKEAFLEAIFDSDIKKVLSQLKVFDSKSIEHKKLINDCITMLKETSIYQLTQDETLVSSLEIKQIQTLSSQYPGSKVIQLIDVLLKVVQDSLINGLYREYLEIAAVKCCQQFTAVSNVEVVNQPAKPNLKPITKTSEPSSYVQPVEENQNTITKDIEFKPTIIEPVEPVITEEFLIECMVLGDKALKQKEMKLWMKLSDYETDFKYRRVSPYLAKAVIAISEPETSILVLPRIEEVEHTNANSQLVRELVFKVLGREKNVIAITKETFDQGVKTFKKLTKENKLPTAQVVLAKRQNVKDEIEQAVIKQPTTEETLLDFFGDAISFTE